MKRLLGEPTHSQPLHPSASVLRASEVTHTWAKHFLNPEHSPGPSAVITGRKRSPGLDFLWEDEWPHSCPPHRLPSGQLFQARGGGAQAQGRPSGSQEQRGATGEQGGQVSGHDLSRGSLPTQAPCYSPGTPVSTLANQGLGPQGGNPRAELPEKGVPHSPTSRLLSQSIGIHRACSPCLIPGWANGGRYNEHIKSSEKYSMKLSAKSNTIISKGYRGTEKGQEVHVD